MTLPEQGGFNERLDVILEEFDHDRDYLQTKDAIRTLVLEVIGENEEVVSDDPPIYIPADARDKLRAEQRKKLGGSDGTK